MTETVKPELENISWRTGTLSVLLLWLSQELPQAGLWVLVDHVTRDIGIALIVGLSLAWTLERMNTRTRAQEVDAYVRSVGDNFVKAVYGKELPSDLFHVVKESIFQQTFIRTSYVSDWWLHNFTAQFIGTAPRNVKELLKKFADEFRTEGLPVQNLVAIRFSVSYEVQNVDAVPRDYVVTWRVPKPFGGNYEGLCGITSVLIDRVQQLPGVYYETEPEYGFADPTQLLYRKSVSIPPGGSVRAELEAYSLRSNDDKEQWQTLIPSRGMSIRVTDADGDKDIFLNLDAPLLKGDESFAAKDPNTNKASLAITQYLLPYQGVTVTWTPSKHRSTATSPAELIQSDDQLSAEPPGG
jgi:hypothetical protein